MMYNDHGIMPSEIMKALNLAYKQNEQNSRQKLKDKVESFFTSLNRAQVEFLALTELPTDLRELVARTIKTLKDWRYNIASIFDFNIDDQQHCVISNNLFSAMSALSDCVGKLTILSDVKTIRQLQTYICEGNALMSEILNALAKKSIAIRRYI